MTGNDKTRKMGAIPNAPKQRLSPTFAGDVTRRRFLVAASTVAAGIGAGPLPAVEQSRRCAEAVKAHAPLRGYGRFDGDLTDVRGKASAQASGTLSYGTGAVEGKAEFA